MRLPWTYGMPQGPPPQPAGELSRPCGCLTDPVVFGHLCQGETLSNTYAAIPAP